MSVADVRAGLHPARSDGNTAVAPSPREWRGSDNIDGGGSAREGTWLACRGCPRRAIPLPIDRIIAADLRSQLTSDMTISEGNQRPTDTTPGADPPHDRSVDVSLYFTAPRVGIQTLRSAAGVGPRPEMFGMTGAKRASVGSSEASGGRLARVGVVGPKRASPCPVA